MKWFILLICLMVLVVGIWTAFFRDFIYSGKEVFQTESSYREFKESIAIPDVKLEDIIVLSSEPPIIVEFTVTVGRDISLNYGHKDNTPLITGLLLIVTGLTGAILSIILVE